MADPGGSSALGDLLGKVLEKLTDPGFVTAGPQAALRVTPATFQSIESEGRWKPQWITAGAARSFELRKQLSYNAAPGDFNFPVSFFTPTSQGMDSQTSNGQDDSQQSDDGDPPAPVKLEVWSNLQRHSQDLFTVNVKGITLNSSFEVDAQWWSDGLEIWGGIAGLASASGFTSIYDDMAECSLYAIPFGNYYPCQVAIFWSGWVNPTGPAFYDFRGGLVLGASGNVSHDSNALSNASFTIPDQGSGGSAPSGPPGFMEYSLRDDGEPVSCDWDDETGFSLDV